MKKALTLLLALALAAGMGGCGNQEAVVLGEKLVESMREEELRFSFDIQYERSRDLTRRLMGSGTATGLMSADMRLEAAYHVEVSEKLTNRITFGGPHADTEPRVSSYETGHTQMHYSGGTLYVADTARTSSGSTMPPVNLQTIPLSDTLRQELTGAGFTGSSLQDVRVADLPSGQELHCGIEPDSELGEVVSALFVALDEGTYNVGSGSFDTGIRTVLTTDHAGRFRQLTLTVERTTLSRSYEVTLTVTADSYDHVDPILLPDYVA